MAQHSTAATTNHQQLLLLCPGSAKTSRQLLPVAVMWRQPKSWLSNMHRINLCGGKYQSTGSDTPTTTSCSPVVVLAPATNTGRKLGRIVALTNHRRLIEGDPVLHLQHM